jgi:hypothetical protein
MTKEEFKKLEEKKDLKPDVRKSIKDKKKAFLNDKTIKK